MRLILDIVPNHAAWPPVLRIAGGWTFWKAAANPFSPPISILTGTLPHEIWREKCCCQCSAALSVRPWTAASLRLFFPKRRKFFVQYFDLIFPLMPRSYRRLLKHPDRRTKKHPVRGFARLSRVFGHHRRLVVANRIVENERGGRKSGVRLDAVRERLQRLVAENSGIAAFIDENVADLNGTPGDAASLCALEHLLGEQHFRLAYWQDPNEGINYRRFFAISDLVGIRVEGSSRF